MLSSINTCSRDNMINSREQGSESGCIMGPGFPGDRRDSGGLLGGGGPAEVKGSETSLRPCCFALEALCRPLPQWRGCSLFPYLRKPVTARHPRLLISGIVITLCLSPARAVGLFISDEQHLSARGNLFLALSLACVSCLGSTFMIPVESSLCQ